MEYLFTEIILKRKEALTICTCRIWRLSVSALPQWYLGNLHLSLCPPDGSTGLGTIISGGDFSGWKTDSEPCRVPYRCSLFLLRWSESNSKDGWFLSTGIGGTDNETVIHKCHYDILPPLGLCLKFGLLVRLPYWTKHRRAFPLSNICFRNLRK